MPKSFKKKLLGAWPDDKKHQATKPLEEKDSETVFGSEPVAGTDEAGDVDKIAESMGIYDKEEEKNPENPDDENEDEVEEVSIADQIKRNNQS